jgi:Rod binding domain-containing protein
MSALSMLDTASYSDAKAAPQTAGAKTQAQARKAAQDFEAFFVGQTMEARFAGSETDGEFDGGNAEKMFRSVLTDQYGKEMAKSGGIGIADQVYAEILKTQEVK